MLSSAISLISSRPDNASSCGIITSESSVLSHSASISSSTDIVSSRSSSRAVSGDCAGEGRDSEGSSGLNGSAEGSSELGGSAEGSSEFGSVEGGIRRSSSGSSDSRSLISSSLRLSLSLLDLVRDVLSGRNWSGGGGYCFCALGLAESV